MRRGECGIRQRRYWEHLIRDDKDLAAHMDYVHVKPLKHGLFTRVADWPFSRSFIIWRGRVCIHMIVAGGFKGEVDYAD